MGDGLDSLKALRKQQELFKQESLIPEDMAIQSDSAKAVTHNKADAHHNETMDAPVSSDQLHDSQPTLQDKPQEPESHSEGERLYNNAPWEALIYPKEKTYFRVCATLSLVFYFLAASSLIYFFILPLLLIPAWITHGLMIGHIKGNGILLSEEQFPAMFNKVVALSKQLELPEPPTVYLLEQGGILNAFATRFSQRNLIVIYADIAELYEDDSSDAGKQAVSFVLAHELAHIARGHVSLWNRILTGPAEYIPFLGTAYSRACEYTCDRFAQHLEPQGCLNGLSLLAVGKKLYGQVNTKLVERQVNQGLGFWPWLSEIVSTHPHLLNRIQQLKYRENN
jgi:Zn-dependent protease with chaperone function